VPQAMARAELGGQAIDALEFTRDEYRADNAFFFDLLTAQKAQFDGTFSPSQALCGSGRCSVAIGGMPLYFDNAHLTQSQRGFWAAALARQMPPRGVGNVD
jgi:SGNH domain (fused to AT3 domains)